VGHFVPQYGEQLKKYRESERFCLELFEANLIAEMKLTEHPKARILFSKAYDLSCGGLEDIANIFYDLAEILQ